MIRHIIKFELLKLSKGVFLPIVGGILLVLTLYATYNGIRRVDSQVSVIEKVKSEEQEFYSTKLILLDSIEKGLRPAPTWYLDPSHPLSAGFFRGAGSYGILHPTSLAIVSSGQSDIFPFFGKVALSLDEARRGNANLDNPVNIATGTFDLAFVLVFLLPLLIIVFSYNTLSAEREQGTFPLLASMPLNINQWLMTVLSLRFLLFICFTWLVLTVSFLLFGIPFSSRWLILFLLVTLYALFWFSLAYWVNTLKKSSSVNALVLISFWIGFVFLLPNVANMLAGYLYPVPSRIGYINAKREAKNEAEKISVDLVNQFYSHHPEMPQQTEGADEAYKKQWRSILIEAEYADSLVNIVESDFTAQLERQEKLASTFVYFSPSLIFQSALNDLSGTDANTYKMFLADLSTFAGEWAGYFKTKFLMNEQLTVADYHQLPAFTSTSIETNYTRYFLLLSGYAFLFIALALVSKDQMGRQ